MSEPGQENIARRVIQGTQQLLSMRGSILPPRTRPPTSTIVTLISSLKPVWFDITLEDEQRQPVQEVRAGQRYILAITGSLVRSTTQLHAEEIYVLEHITLHWRCITDISVLNGDTFYKQDLANESISLSYEEAISFRQEFALLIPQHFPSCNLLLELSYALPEKNGHLGQRRIPLQGSYTPENTQWLTAWQLAQGLPEEVAVLAISNHPTSTEASAFKIRGWQRQASALDENATPQTVISIERLMEHRDPPYMILAKMRRFSSKVPQALKDWLQELTRKYGTELCIIIIDSTTLEIPWELLEFTEGPDLTARYLGANTRVVRWLPREYIARPSLLHIGKQEQVGSVIAYLDQTLGQHETSAELSTLATLETVHYASLQQLEERIYRPLHDVGMVYIGCHGQEGKTLYQQLQEHGQEALTSIRLELIEPQPEPRPTVFINACEAARIIRGDIWDDSSFVEGFLYRCASGFLGPIARVGTGEASRIARQILEQIRAPRAGQIAEVLRALRAEALREWQAAQTEGVSRDKRRQSEYNVLYTFLYIYYGNPLAHLSLNSAGEKGGMA